MKYIKSIYGSGVVAKTIKLQIFLEPKMYFEVLQEAKSVGITYRNDSELVRKIMYKFFEDLPMLTIQVEHLKEQNARKQSVIDELQSLANNQKGAKKK